MQKRNKRLELNRETLNRLGEMAGLADVNGAATASCSCLGCTTVCTVGCPGTKGPSCVPTGCTQEN